MNGHDPITCPYCKLTAHHTVHSQTRIFRDLKCGRCGGEWRIDRATGKLVTRLATKERTR
jgi:hypothetical protein